MEINLEVIALVAGITAGIVQTLKLAKFPSGLAPVAALGVGIAVASLIAKDFSPTIWLTGIIAGLSSQGLYDNLKKGKSIITGK